MDELFLVSGREHSLWSLLHVALPVARESNGELACQQLAGPSQGQRADHVIFSWDTDTDSWASTLLR